MHDIAAVSCTDTQADLEPDLYQLMTSAYLEDKPLFLLQCAMEENCVASQAYTERQTNPYWQQITRRLLRFTTAISNIGTADFRPFIPKKIPGNGTPATRTIIPWRLSHTLRY